MCVTKKHLCIVLCSNEEMRSVYGVRLDRDIFKRMLITSDYVAAIHSLCIAEPGVDHGVTIGNYLEVQ